MVLTDFCMNKYKQSHLVKKFNILCIIFYVLLMRLKKVWRKDKQLQCRLKQSEPIWSKANPDCIEFYKQVKQNIIRASKETSLEQLTVIDLTQRNQNINLETQRLLDNFIEIFIQQISYQSASTAQLSINQKNLMVYFAKQMVLEKTSPQQSKIWKYRELLMLGVALLREIEQFKGKFGFDSARLQQALIFNNAVCYTELHMFIEALSCLVSLQKMEVRTNVSLKYRIDNLKDKVLISMGRPWKQVPYNKLSEKDPNSQTQPTTLLAKSKEFFMLVSKSKTQLLQFVQKELPNQSIFIDNAYNLALLCKKHRLYTHSSTILSNLLSETRILKRGRLIKRCLVLMAIIKEEQKEYNQAIKYIQIIKPQNQEETRQINARIWELKKKKKLENAISSCPGFSAKTFRKYQLLQSLHDDLDKLTQKPSKVIHQKDKKLTSTIYRPKNKKKYLTRPPSQVDLKKSQSALIPNLITALNSQTSFQKVSQPQFRKKNSQVLSLRNDIEKSSCKAKQARIKQEILKAEADKEEKPQIQQARVQRLKKTVRFRVEGVEQPREEAIDLIYKYEERIMGAVIQQKKGEAMSYIHQAFQKVGQLQGCIVPWTLANFKIKCINWCKQVKSKEQAVSLLEKQISRIDQNTTIKIKFMKQLATLYEEMFQYRKAIKVSLQLAGLGEIEYLERSGQLCLAKQNYSEASHYFELYYQKKPTIQALVKLAHTYSKICTHVKIAVQILNDLLFETRNTCIFKCFDSSDSENIQNAVILLATIHINMNGIKRAQQICQGYLKVNFSAYPVYYLLGIINHQCGKEKQAFNYFINALKLKPNHLPSLIEVVKHIGLGHSNTSQILSLLRRAFVYNHRNWELLQLLIQGITNTHQDKHPISIKRLIEYARILEQMGGVSEDLSLEAELVWIWALEYIEQKKHYLPCFDQQYSTICIRLGQINLKKGNYDGSEFYFKKILLKLHEGKFHPSRCQADNVRLELQLLDRMVYIKLQQQKQDDAFDILNQSQSLAKTNSLQIWAAQISRKIANLKQLLQTQ